MGIVEGIIAEDNVRTAIRLYESGSISSRTFIRVLQRNHRLGFISERTLDEATFLAAAREGLLQK